MSVPTLAVAAPAAAAVPATSPTSTTSAPGAAAQFAAVLTDALAPATQVPTESVDPTSESEDATSTEPTGSTEGTTSTGTTDSAEATTPDSTTPVVPVVTAPPALPARVDVPAEGTSGSTERGLRAERVEDGGRGHHLGHAERIDGADLADAAPAPAPAGPGRADQNEQTEQTAQVPVTPSVPTDDPASTVLSSTQATTAAPVDRAGGATTLAPVRPTDTSDSTPTSTPTAAAPPVSDQIAAHLRGVRRTAQGVHEATLVLEPEHLGPVRIRMQVEDGVVALSMAGLQVATTEALKDALPELRRTLAEAGLQLGTADVADASSWSDWNRQDPGTRGQGTSAQGRTAHADRTGVPTILRAVDPTARPLSPAHAGVLDLLA